MADLYVSIISYIAIFGVAGALAVSAFILALPTAVALFSKFEGASEQVLLIRPKAHDYDEDN
jgi:hypothetical protein